MPPVTRGRAHRRAASILREEGAPNEVVAGHLLVSPADGDPIAIDALRVAARDTIGSGEAESAARLLERALAEQPTPEVYPELLAGLGQAEALAGLPRPPTRLQEAISAAEEPERRAELALAQGRALVAQGSYEDAAAALAAGLGEFTQPDAPVIDELTSAFISASSQVPHLVDQALDRRREMLGRLDGQPDTGQRLALAQTVIHDGLRGDQRATVRKLADLAWSEGALLDPRPPDDTSFSALTASLLMVDELERELEICEAALAVARDREAPLAYATVSHSKAWADSSADRSPTPQPARRRRWTRVAMGRTRSVRPTALSRAVTCWRVSSTRPRRALAIVDDERVQDKIRHPFLIDVRAQLRLAQHRPEEALADAMQAGRVLESNLGVTNPGVVAWRSTAALAHLALGQPVRPKRWQPKNSSARSESGSRAW